MKFRDSIPAVLLVFVLALGPASCAALGREMREPCPPSQLAALETAYVLEAVTACKAEGATFATCKALPTISDKYRAKRAAYVECK